MLKLEKIVRTVWIHFPVLQNDSELVRLRPHFTGFLICQAGDRGQFQMLFSPRQLHLMRVQTLSCKDDAGDDFRDHKDSVLLFKFLCLSHFRCCLCVRRWGLLLLSPGRGDSGKEGSGAWPRTLEKRPALLISRPLLSPTYHATLSMKRS